MFGDINNEFIYYIQSYVFVYECLNIDCIF